MAPSESINYPDFVGFITGDRRANTGDVQCALSIHPPVVSPGDDFEVLCLLQNTFDVSLNISLDLNLPDRDVFHAEQPAIDLELGPAEVGLAVFAVACSAGSASGKDYGITVGIKMKRPETDKKATRIRAKEGAGKVIPAVLPESTRQQLVSLRALSWEARLSRGRLEGTLKVSTQSPPTVSTHHESGWNSLWMLDVHLDEHLLAQHVAGELNAILPHFTVEKMFKPLFAATQKQFSGIYPMKTAETLHLAKLLTHVLCNTVIEKPASRNAPPPWPEWYRQLLRMLFLEPLFSTRPEQTVTQWLYPYLLQDAIMQGFTMIKGVADADFGDEAERRSYAGGIVGVFKKRQRLNFEQIYLPLVCASALIADQIVMPHEKVPDTLAALERVCEGRTAERTDENTFIFDLFHTLINQESKQLQ